MWAVSRTQAKTQAFSLKLFFVFFRAVLALPFTHILGSWIPMSWEPRTNLGPTCIHLLASASPFFVSHPSFDLEGRMAKDCHLGSAQRLWLLVSLRLAQTVATDVCPLASGCSPIGAPCKIWRCVWAEMLKIALKDKSQLAMERDWFAMVSHDSHGFPIANGKFVMVHAFSIVPLIDFVACQCSLPTGLWIDASTICFQPFDDWFYGPILSEERREDIAAPRLLVDAECQKQRGWTFETFLILCITASIHQFTDLTKLDFDAYGRHILYAHEFCMLLQQNLVIAVSHVFFVWNYLLFFLPKNGRSMMQWTRRGNIQAFYFSAWGCEMHKSKDTSKTWGPQAMCLKDGKNWGSLF